MKKNKQEKRKKSKKKKIKLKIFDRLARPNNTRLA